LLVSLVVLAAALWLMAWFGIGASCASMPIFDVKATCVAVIPVRKVLRGVRIWGSFRCRVRICIHWRWWGNVAILIVDMGRQWNVAILFVVQLWCIATSAP
jgi:hypothetical protein